jgi:hypothetical protein
MEPSSWAIDWNPAYEDDHRVQRSVVTALAEEGVLDTIERLASQSIEEALADGFETEHLVWLDGESRFAFFVRVWFEASEDKLFLVVEENDLGDVGFLQLDGHDCASYDGRRVLKVELEEPETLGVEP